MKHDRYPEQRVQIGLRVVEGKCRQPLVKDGG